MAETVVTEGIAVVIRGPPSMVAMAAAAEQEVPVMMELGLAMVVMVALVFCPTSMALQRILAAAVADGTPAWEDMAEEGTQPTR